MKEIKLLKLEMVNFKKFANKTVDFTDNTIIRGANESGKTTIIDALYWLLFDKDSSGSSAFSIKPLNENGESLKGVQVSVRGTFTVNDQVVTLKKTLVEEWVTKRGTTTAAFSGHHKDLEINDVPGKSAGEFNTFVNDMVGEKLFTLITNPHQFNSLDNKKKREILLSAVNSNVTDLDIINQNENLNPLIKYLKVNGSEVLRSVEDTNTIAKTSLNKLTAELKQIAPRIDEVNRIITSTAETDNAVIEEANEQIAAIDETIMKLQQETDVSAKLERKNVLKTELLDLRSSLLKATESNPNAIAIKEKKKELEDANAKLILQKMELTKLITTDEYDLDFIQKAIVKSKKKIEELNALLPQLREQCSSISKEEITGNELTCPTCGQPFQEDKKQEILKNFNIQKADRLQYKIAEGKQAKADLEAEATWLETSVRTAEELKKKLAENTEKLADLEQALKNNTATLTDLNVSAVVPSTEMVELEQKIDAKEQEINSIVLTTPGDKGGKILELQNRRNEVYKAKMTAEYNISNRKRLLELQQEQATKQVQRSEAEVAVMLCEEFNKTKCRFIEEKINNLFSFVKFKLFKQNINGGIEDCCIATVKGVPYNDVNSAGKINAGLDIIRTLQRINDVKTFIFVDNAESNHNILPMDNQMIKMYVDEKYSEITIFNE